MPWTDRASALWSTAGIAAGIAAVVTALAYGPLLYEYFAYLGAKPYYQHYPFVLAAFGWLLAQRLMAAHPRELDKPSEFGPTAAAALAAVAWALLALAYFAHSPWLACVSLVVLAGAGMVYANALWHVEGLGAVWLLLWLIVTPPFGKDQVLIAFLQRVSSRASSFVLDALGVSHVMEGNKLTLLKKELFVDEACSGIISVLSIIACAAIYGVWRRRSAVHVVVLIIAGVAWATVMNTLRISSIAYMFSARGVDWSEGWVHEVLSLCVFTLTFLSLISSDVLLAGLLAPVARAWDEHHDATFRWGRWLASGWDWALGHSADEAGDSPIFDEDSIALPRWPWLLRIALPLAFIALPAWSFMARAPAEVLAAPASGAGQAALNRALALNEAFLPEQIGLLRRQKFEIFERDRNDAMGNHSRTHTYVDSRGTLYLVSCDFAYEGGWHELVTCYQGVGWTVDDRTVHTDPASAAAHPWPRMEARFSKPGGVHAFVAASAFDDQGQYIDLPRGDLWERIKGALSNQRNVKTSELAFQTQVWTTSAEPIDHVQRETVRDLLLVGRARFRDLVTGDAAAPATTPALSSAAEPSSPENTAR